MRSGYNTPLGSHEKFGPQRRLLPRTNPPAPSVSPPRCSSGPRGDIHGREDEPMPERQSSRGLMFCVLATGVLIALLLAYQGAFDEIGRGLWDIGYDILRAVNSE